MTGFMLIFVIIRRIPYPPIFSNTPASIIDPTSVASTCAFGSHMCDMKIGSLNKKIIISSTCSLEDIEKNLIGKVIDDEFDIRNSVEIRNGRDTAAVKNSMNILADARSGLFPVCMIDQNIRRKIVSNPMYRIKNFVVVNDKASIILIRMKIIFCEFRSFSFSSFIAEKMAMIIHTVSMIIGTLTLSCIELAWFH